MLIQDEIVDINTSTGLMRCFLCEPTSAGKFPAVILFSEIYQTTEPVKRFARSIAGMGYLVICPDVYHEFLSLGEVLPYDTVGTDRGNELKCKKTIESYDADVVAVVNYLKKRENCSGKIGSTGICLGGHLAFRSSFHPEILASVCFFATDIHSSNLGYGKRDDSLSRCKDIKGELVMIWGIQDPHIPMEGRNIIRHELQKNNVDFQWCEFNANHAFVRDESSKGRYDPSVTKLCFAILADLFSRRLQLGIESSKSYQARPVIRVSKL